MMMTSKMMAMGMATHSVMMIQSFLFLDLRIAACSGKRRGRKSERERGGGKKGEGGREREGGREGERRGEEGRERGKESMTLCVPLACSQHFKAM